MTFPQKYHKSGGVHEIVNVSLPAQEVVYEKQKSYGRLGLWCLKKVVNNIGRNKLERGVLDSDTWLLQFLSLI